MDGCADRPSPALNFTTPLEAAYTPFLDMIASRSRLGRVVTVGRGISPESDIAVFNMLGYSFKSGYPGRGVVEAVGAGIRLKDGDLAFRANLASVEGRKIVDRRAGRDLTQEEAAEIGEALNSFKLTDAQFEFRPTISYRGVLVIRADEPLSAAVTNTDPAYAKVGGFGAARATKKGEEILESRPESDGKEVARSAALVNEFTRKSTEVLRVAEVNRRRRALGKLPANAVLLRDAGDRLPDVEPFKKRHGMMGTALVEMPAEVGIAILLGMRMVRIRDRSDTEAKARLFRNELKEDTIVYAHLKGPDEFGHDGDPVGKKRCIEGIDRDFFSLVSESIQDSNLAVSCDHATPCTLGMHSDDPVPLLVRSGEGRDSMRFTEASAKKGSLGLMAGAEVLDYVTRKERRARHRIS